MARQWMSSASRMLRKGLYAAACALMVPALVCAVALPLITTAVALLPLVIGVLVAILVEWAHAPVRPSRAESARTDSVDARTPTAYA